MKRGAEASISKRLHRGEKRVEYSKEDKEVKRCLKKNEKWADGLAR